MGYSKTYLGLYLPLNALKIVQIILLIIFCGVKEVQEFTRSTHKCKSYMLSLEIPQTEPFPPIDDGKRAPTPHPHTHNTPHPPVKIIYTIS